MTEVRFYHLQTSKLEGALPSLVARVLDTKRKIILKATSPEYLAFLDGLLWSYDADSFIPHSSLRDGFESEQPVWLSTGDDNPNAAEILILTEGASSATPEAFSIICEVFDGNNDVAVMSARQKWKHYQSKGFPLAYFQQTESGKWEKKAEA